MAWHGIASPPNPFAIDFKPTKDLLPKWWNVEKRGACERLAVDGTQWANISAAVEKSDVIEYYGDPIMPMKLRMLAEKVYGKKINMGY